MTVTEIASTLTTPFAEVMDPPVPSNNASTGFDTWTARLPVAAAESVNVTVAITPSLSGLELSPANKQVWLAQYSDFCAATAAGPAVVVTDATSGLGEFSVHSSPSELPG